MKKLGLALSGGAARAIAHVGVLQVLEEEGIPVAALAGTSGGAMVAAMYTAGLSAQDLVSLAHRLRWRDLAEVRLNRLGFFSTRPIREFLETWIGEPRFEDLRIPCAVVATDLSNFEPRIFRRGPVLPAVEASCAIPHVYRPVEWEGRVYLDGGIVNFLPVECLRDLGAEVRIGVSTMSGKPRGSRPGHLVHLMLLFSRFIQYNNFVLSRRHADLVLVPEVQRFPVYELHNAEGLLEAGRQAARAALGRIRALLDGEAGPTS
jgi:NTE family protein